MPILKTRYFRAFTVDGVDYELMVSRANVITLSQPFPMLDEFGDEMSGTETTNENRGTLRVIRKTIRCVTDYIFDHRPSITKVSAGGDKKKFALYARIAEKWQLRLNKAGYVLLINKFEIFIIKEAK